MSIKKPMISRLAPQIEKVDETAAKEIWNSIRVAVDDIYNKVSHRDVYAKCSVVPCVILDRNFTCIW